MTGHVVTLNAGSSSMKFGVFTYNAGALSMIASGLVEMVGAERHSKVKDSAGSVLHEEHSKVPSDSTFHADGLRHVLAWHDETFPSARVVAASHRVVHGGVLFDRSVVVTDAVLAELADLVPLAPLHQPHNIAGILAARAAWPNVPQVACFDTAFHRGHPFVHDTFGLPPPFYDEGLRRYGFHGLSYEYVTVWLRSVAPLQAAGRVVVAHLGNGSSMCAMRDGKSIASTMSFSTMDGLPMGTRCGQLDPGVILYLMREKNLDVTALSDLLHKESGLKGMSGLSYDMRELEASESPAARDAIDYFVARIRYELGGLAAAVDGLDALVFCGGIGENSWRVREAALRGMEWFGIELDPVANRAGAEVISTDSSRVRVFVTRTDEEAMIARHAVEELASSPLLSTGLALAAPLVERRRQLAEIAS